MILSVCLFGDPLTGLVTRLSRLTQATPLANGEWACSAGRTARYPERVVNDQRQSGQLRWHWPVP